MSNRFILRQLAWTVLGFALVSWVSTEGDLGAALPMLMLLIAGAAWLATLLMIQERDR